LNPVHGVAIALRSLASIAELGETFDGGFVSVEIEPASAAGGCAGDEDWVCSSAAQIETASTDRISVLRVELYGVVRGSWFSGPSQPAN